MYALNAVTQSSVLMGKYIAVQIVGMNINRGEKIMRFCPRCGSTNIDWVLPQDWSKWECKDCGYIGPLIVEDGKIADKIREDYQKEHQHK